MNNSRGMKFSLYRVGVNVDMAFIAGFSRSRSGFENNIWFPGEQADTVLSETFSQNAVKQHIYTII